MVIVESEAEIVREIFARHLESRGDSPPDAPRVTVGRRSSSRSDRRAGGEAPTLC